MPVTYSQFERAVLLELWSDVEILLATLPNWKGERFTKGLCRFRFGTETSLHVRIQIHDDGSLTARMRQPSVAEGQSECWLGHLAAPGVFANAATRLVESVQRRALPFLRPDLDSFRTSRMILLKACYLARVWSQLSDEEVSWVEDLIDEVIKNLRCRHDPRSDRWKLLLATAYGMFHDQALSHWFEETEKTLEKAIPTPNRRRWFKNRYQELVEQKDESQLARWESVVDLEETDWFIRKADLPTLLMADHLV